MRHCLSILAAACLALAAAPALAQTPDTDDEDDFVFDRACMDDDGRDLCDQGMWSKIVANFGLEPAELVQRAGFRGVRVFTVDGYGRDMPAITILTPGGARDPELAVHWETFRGAPTAHRARLSRIAPPDLWRLAADLQSLTATSPDRQPTAEKLPDDRVVICLHAWVTVTESLTDSGVTRRIRNACGDDPLFDASYGMSGEALRSFPDCVRIDPANHRNESTILRRCFALDGPDPATAAEVLNLMDGEIDDTIDLKAMLAPDVSLTRAGHSDVSGSAAVAEAFADPELTETSLYANHVTAEPGRVTASGYIQDYREDDLKAATMQLVWVRPGNDWRIGSIAIGPFKIEN